MNQHCLIGGYSEEDIHKENAVLGSSNTVEGVE